MSLWGWSKELEAELEGGVPERLDLDQLEAQLVLRMDLRGAYGETQLIVAAGQLWIWTRSSLWSPLVPVSLSSLPRLEGEGFDWELVLEPVGQAPSRLLLMVADHEAARRLVSCARMLPRPAVSLAPTHDKVSPDKGSAPPASVAPPEAKVKAAPKVKRVEPSRLTPWRTLRWSGPSWDELERHQGPLSCMVFGGEGGFVSASEDGVVVSWHLDEGQALWSAKQGRHPALSSDGHQLALLNEGGEVEVWDLEHERLKGRFKPSGQVRRICYGADGIGVEVEDGLELWALAPVKRTGRTRRKGTRHHGLCFAPDSSRAALIMDSTAVVIDPRTSRRASVLEGDGVLALSFVDADCLVCVDQGGTLKVWSLGFEQPQVLATVELGDMGGGAVLDALPLGRAHGQVLCGSARGELVLCDVQGQLLERLSLPGGPISALAIDPGARRVAVGLQDRVELFELRALDA